MTELSFSLLCFNIANKCGNKDIIRYICNTKPDLCFLQEIRKDEVKCHKTVTKAHIGDELMSWKHNYGVVYLQEASLRGSSNSQTNNCIFYNKSKFCMIGERYVLHEEQYKDSLIHELLNDYDIDHGILKRRACLAILQYNGSDSNSTWHPRIIVVSFHNPYRGLTRDKITSNATKFFNTYGHLGQITGYPVLVAGDFNCELLKYKGDKSNFMVLKYNPTIHRALVIRSRGDHEPCIDFFAYKNYSGCTEIEVNDVHADLVPHSDDCPITGAGDQCNLGPPSSSILKQINSNAYVSDHDPLRATLTVKFVPNLTISYYNINNDQNVTNYLTTSYPCTPDLVIIHNIDASQKLTSHNLCGYEHIKFFNSTRLYYKRFKFCCFGNPIVDLNSFKFSYLELYHRENRGLRSIITFVIKSSGVNGIENGQECIIKLLNQWRVEKSCNAIIIMGDFNPTELPGDLPLVHARLEHTDKCFIAYMNDRDMPVKHGEVVSFYQFSVEEKFLKSQSIPHYKALLNFKFVDFYINALYLNIEGTNNDHSISSYFTNLNPKPNLFIFQKSQGIQIEEILNIDELPYEICSESTVVYNSDLFELKSHFQLQNDNNDLVITGCVVKCLKIIDNPELIVASISLNTNNATESFKQLDSKTPILIAGTGFKVDLDSLQDNYGFKVSKCNPTIPRKLIQKQPMTIDFFAYRSSAITSIKLEDVHAETIIPCPGLVTGSGGYNIDYDQICTLSKVRITEHDPVRAKVTIQPLKILQPSQTHVQKSSSVPNLSTQQIQTHVQKSSSVPNLSTQQISPGSPLQSIPPPPPSTPAKPYNYSKRAQRRLFDDKN